MANINSLIIKNKLYDNTRLTIVGSQSGNSYIHYSEANGTRFYVNQLTATGPAPLETITFNAYLSFTSSGTQSWNFKLIPVNVGNTVIMQTKILGMKSDGTKAFLMNSFGGWKHSGSTLTTIGGPLTYDYKTDFTGATAYFTASATASIDMIIKGSSGDIIDWDVYIDYTVGYHSLTAITPLVNQPAPWYPPNQS